MIEDTSRANWNFLYEKGLIEVLTEHKVDTRFKGRNGWNSDGWRSITCKFNEKFPLAHFTKQQLQDKEKVLKASYKAINNAKKESGVGWNESMGMISAESDLWLKCASKFPKIKKHRKNGFPLFRSCEALYEGSIATGDLRFTSTEPVEPVHLGTSMQIHQSVGGPSTTDTNPFSTSVDAQETSEAHSTPPETLTQQHGSGKKRKQSEVSLVLDDYLEHKKNQYEKAVEIMLGKKNRAKNYSIGMCLDTVNGMEELTDEEKAIATEIFENELYREMFMEQKDLSVRLIWLQRKIRRLAPA